MLGQFIARAIADHILPMSFLDCYKGKVDCDHARLAKTLTKAKLLVPLISSTVQKSPLAASMFTFALFKYDLCHHVDFCFPSSHSYVNSPSTSLRSIFTHLHVRLLVQAGSRPRCSAAAHEEGDRSPR